MIARIGDLEPGTDFKFISTQLSKIDGVYRVTKRISNTTTEYLMAGQEGYFLYAVSSEVFVEVSNIWEELEKMMNEIA